MNPLRLKPVTRAVFFDIDFTLIHPGPAFQGSGYREACAAHGVTVDEEAFERAVNFAARTLDASGGPFDPEVFVDYTCQIIQGMGGTGGAVRAAARDIYDRWAACDHFTLYEDVPDVLRSLHVAGMKIGLISNTQRCLGSFQRHFDLDGLFAVTISSADHGFMKPHPSIFAAGLRALGMTAAESVMVGDSLAHDIEGARRMGMRAVLVARSGLPGPAPAGVPVIQSLRELPPLL
ncbi:MAG: HAD family hydrolase [Acidobacteria bacterium]|nr:HAD family hydrolase [Acidobacteriota bacterium]